MEFVLICITCVLIFTIGIICISIYDSYFLKISRYEISNSKILSDFSGYKIIHLTDLHGREFGKNNNRLIKKIDAENPDIIVMTGDMAKNEYSEVDSLYNLLKVLTKKYIVLYTLGNQEYRYSKEERIKFKKELNSIGVIVVHDDKYIVSKNNSKMNIYGLGYKWQMILEPKTTREKEICSKIVYNMLGEAEENMFNILITHDASNFEAYTRWNADLVFAGHLHGGMIRLFGRGLLSPKRAILPNYTKGKYQNRNTTMISNTGLAKFRLFNTVEIVVCVLK